VVHHTNVADAQADERKMVCYHCGVACDLDAMKAERIDFLERMGAEQADSLDEGAPKFDILKKLAPGEHRANRKKPPVRPSKVGIKVRYRMRYAKLGVAALTGHLDLVREMPRLLRMAGLKPWMTQGFKPRPVFKFGPALRLGWQAAADLVDIWVEHLGDDPPPTAEHLAEVLTDESNVGLVFVDGRILAEDEKPLATQLAAADWVVVAPADLLDKLGPAPDVVRWVRKDKEKTANWSDVVIDYGVRPAVGLPACLDIEPDLRVFTVRTAHRESSPRPTEILAALIDATADELNEDSSVARVRLWLRDEAGALVDALAAPCETPTVA
jgi:radical SAM-linked protein